MTKKKRLEERNLKRKLMKANKETSLLSPKTEGQVKVVKPVYNSEGKMVFSKFDFSETGAENEDSNRKKKQPKDPQKILKMLEKKNEKLSEIETTEGENKVQEVKEKEAWKKAVERTQGVKVKDDPELLKKSVKKKLEKKKHSKKKWKGRQETVQKRQQEVQSKRSQNIEKKKDEKKKKKIKKAIKKGRIIPGLT